MGTEKLFWLDAYQKEFDATVRSVNENQVILNQTCFYAASGGQIGDTGEINGQRVADTVYGENDEIIHIMEEKPKFQEVDVVHGKIDWERRYNIMRLHTSAHIISAVLVRDLGNILFTGSQIYPDRARMDFNIEKMDDKTMKFIEEKSNEVVQMSIPVVSRIITQEYLKNNPQLFRLADTSHYEKYKTLRVVEIQGIDTQLDGGTHVANTTEVGRIKIVKRENKGKNNRRITIIVE